MSPGCCKPPLRRPTRPGRSGKPTPSNPRSAIIEWLMGTLDVAPERVMDPACRLTTPVAWPAVPSPDLGARRAGR
ncbi:MAG: hypothetical protein IH627_19640 [Rubrivivax sp.]|nr:hypothetical protein [Rubrivivax sp.]